MLDPKAYEGREQTYIKHFVLQRYLQKLAYKVGSWCPTLNYVDCFAGPWKHENEDLSDTSPFIAIRELGEVQQDWQSRDRSFEARCLFIEKNQASHRLLSAKISEQDRVEARALRGRFPLDVIGPLIRWSNCEVLINFMTQHISRFVSSTPKESRTG